MVLAMSVVGVASADEIVVDNTSPNVLVSGAWTSTALTPGFSGTDYLFRPASSGDATVFWPFPVTTGPGRYEVQARWSSGPNRATNALYWVASDTGTLPVTRNQQINGGTWQSLGRFDFKPGKSQGVTLSDRADGVVIADALKWVGPLSGEVLDAPGGAWTVALDSVDLHAGPDDRTDVLARLPQFSYLQVQSYAGEWAYVYNPRGRGTAYLPSRLLGPSDAPPNWVTAPAPVSIGAIEQLGRTIGGASVAFYPVEDKFAYVARLGHNEPVVVHDRVRGADGSIWYRVDQGYLAEGSVRLPRPPDRTFSGRWIDADLNEPAMLVAYDGDRVAMNTLAIKGRIASATPMGVFSIGRRVEDETMDSSTLGVPNDSPEGYKLEHVLFTQYFTADGASIHYNYWSSNFGYSGSHGCLGIDRAASEFLWNWATYGTPVVIHS
jgi:hypothetical protein